MYEKNICTVNWQKINNRAVFKLQWILLIPPNPKERPGSIPGIVAPGDAASIIFPRNNGKRLVVKADNAINTSPNMNWPLYGFKYLNKTSASRRLSFEIFAFGEANLLDVLSKRFAILNES
jgi:hypothetical protein